MNYSSIALDAETIIRSTAEWIKSERLLWDLKDLKSKEDTSLVTSIDLGSEARLVEGFSKILPDSHFLAEENYKEHLPNDLLWIIDPIDGTTNMVHNLPMYCISVALQIEAKTVLGIIYEITSGECFIAHAGSDGATLNGKRISVSKADSLKNTLLATGFPTVDFSRIEPYIDILKTLMKSTRGMRRLGSAAMDLAYVACGRCDGFYEYGLNAWDVAAGAYLVEKAGGKVSDFRGENDFLHGREILGSNGLFHDEFLQVFKDVI